MKRLIITLLIICSSIAFWKVWARELETSRLNAGYLSTFNLRPSTLYFTFNLKPWTLPNGQSSTGGTGGTSSGGTGTSIVSGGNAAGGGGGGVGGSSGATATQYILTYTAANANPCKIEVSTNSNYSPVVYAVDATKFSGANMDGQTSTGARAFLVGQRIVAQENVSPPSVTLSGGNTLTRVDQTVGNATYQGAVTVSYNSQPFSVGDNIIVSNMNDPSFNETWARVMATTANSFTYWTPQRNGGIVSATVASGGSGYKPGNWGVILGGSHCSFSPNDTTGCAGFIVTGVSSGAVTSFIITPGWNGAGAIGTGTSYTVANGLATSFGIGVGTGTGFTVNVTAVGGSSTTGNGSTSTVTRANRYSLALQSSTQYFYRLGGASNTCGASPATGTFTTMNWPNGDTWQENYPTDSSGNWITPTVPESTAALSTTPGLIDPITGTLVKPATIFSMGNWGAWFEGGSGGDFHCTNTVDSNNFYHCQFGFHNSGGSGMIGVNPTTGESRFLGTMGGSASACAGALNSSPQNLGQWDETNPNVWYSACYATAPIRTYVYKVTYTGNDVAQASGVTAPNTTSNLTPPAQNASIEQLLATFDPTYNTNRFQQSFTFDGVQNNYVAMTGFSYQQNSFGWDVIFKIGDGLPIDSTCGSTRMNCPRIVAAKTTWANQQSSPACSVGPPPTCNNDGNHPFGGLVTRWCGSHGCGPLGLQQNWANTGPGELNGGSGITGPFQETLQTTLNATDVTDTITVSSTTALAAACNTLGLSPVPTSGDPTQPLSGLPPDGCNWLDQALPGDIFAFEDTGTEWVMVIARNSATSLTIGRGCHSGAGTAAKVCDGTNEHTHSIGATMHGLCWVEFSAGGAPGVVWDVGNDPHGTDQSNTYLVFDYKALNGHGGAKVPIVIEEHGGWGIKQNATWDHTFFTRSLDREVAGQSYFTVNGTNISNLCNGALCFSYPHYYANPVVNWGWDANVYSGAVYGNNHVPWTVTAVPSTTYLFTAPFLQKNSVLPYFALDGIKKLIDISGPGSVLHDTTADNYKFCMVQNANECVSGSTTGHVYVNLPDYVATNSCHTGGEGGFNYNGDFCPENTLWTSHGIVQIGSLATSNQMGTDGNNGNAPIYDFGLSRHLVTGLFGPPRQIRPVSMQDNPDQSWAYWAGCLSDPNSPVIFPTGDRCNTQMYMAQIPPQPPNDGIVRTTFENVSVTIGAGSGGATHAAVTFGYEENEPTKTVGSWPRTPHFYCTQYQGQCYYQSGNFSNTGLSNATSLSLNSTQTLQIGVPQRVLFYQVEYLNGSNQVVATDPVQVAAIP